jgi:hypothetical protein
LVGRDGISGDIGSPGLTPLNGIHCCVYKKLIDVKEIS